jgi:hypothetical protein
MRAWKAIVRRRLAGERLRLTHGMSWPPVGKRRESAWPRAIADLKREHARLRATIARYDPARLDAKPVGRHSAYLLMHGVIQHDLWHAGQIMLIRRCDF